MTLWADGTGGDETIPKYLHSDNIRHHYDPNKCYASMKGWEIFDENLLNEVLVAIPGLSNSLAGATIRALEFGDDVYTSNTLKTVVVVYNEAVTVSALNELTLVVTGSVTGSITATHTATYKNRLTFSFTVPGELAQTLVVADQTIGAGAATVVDGDGNAATSSRVITTTVAAAMYPAVITNVTIDSITLAAFDAATYHGRETSHLLTLTYSGAVTVVGSKTIATVWTPALAPSIPIAGPVATYSTGTGSAILVFTIAAIPDEAGVLSVVAQNIGGAGTMKDADAVLVQKNITATLAATLTPKTVTIQTITLAALDAATYYGTEATHTLTITYNGIVNVVGSGGGVTPTIATVWSGTTGPVGPVATYSTGTGSTALVFTIAAIPDEVGSLSLATQTIGGTATMRDSFAAGVNRVISPTLAATVTPKTVLPDAPVTVVWDATAPFLKNTAEYLLVNYGAAVTVAGGTPTVLVNWSGVSGPTLLASYASGTGTSALRFNFAIPDEGGTASFAAQTILGTGTMKGSHGDTVNHIIAAGAVAATGSKVVAP